MNIDPRCTNPACLHWIHPCEWRKGMRCPKCGGVVVVNDDQGPDAGYVPKKENHASSHETE